MPLCRCILLKFYIKPQLRLERELAYCVVSYRNSTSNHNEGEPLNTQRKLYLIEILHQTTTLNFIGREFILLYLIEILHQTTTGLAAGLGSGALYLIEILHQTTTLNLANFFAALLYLIEILHQTTTPIGARARPLQLYLIEILHQTTTIACCAERIGSCILSKFYIKPQPPPFARTVPDRCILSKFYIKPQLAVVFVFNCVVVSYRNSTSNHNASRPTI